MPCEGGEAVKPANEDRLNNNAGPVSTPDLKNLSYVDEIDRKPENTPIFNELHGRIQTHLVVAMHATDANHLVGIATQPFAFSGYRLPRDNTQSL